MIEFYDAENLVFYDGAGYAFQQRILETEQKGCMTMCGIVGYIGTEQAAPIILDGLSKLEYRGYDSADYHS